MLPSNRLVMMEILHMRFHLRRFCSDPDPGPELLRAPHITTLPPINICVKGHTGASVTHDLGLHAGRAHQSPNIYSTPLGSQANTSPHLLVYIPKGKVTASKCYGGLWVGPLRASGTDPASKRWEGLSSGSA